MSAQPARHRVTNTDAIDAASGFWAAKDLLGRAESTGAPKHARKVAPRYAVHVGRVGALAVSLGIGFAIANSATAVAYAETDSDSGSNPSASPNTSGSDGSGQASDDSKDTKSTGDGDGDGDSEDSDDDAEGPADEESDPDPDEAEEEADGPEDAVSPRENTSRKRATAIVHSVDTEVATAATVAADEDTEVVGPANDVDQPEPPPAEGAPAPEVTATSLRTDQAFLSAEVVPTAEATVEVNVVGAVVSKLVAPLVDTGAPVQSAVTDPVLAWIRRLISHTFFNKTPVIDSIGKTFLPTGQVIIDVNATDPNGDPLTYEIIQPDPSVGVVFQVPLTSQFVFTPLLPVLGQPLGVDFSIIVKDDSEHLTGVLGSIQSLLHSLSRAFGLAQADNKTVGVAFEVPPLVQFPPAVLAVGGLPYVLGADPVKLVSIAEITDADTPTLQEALISVGVGQVAGDKLGYIAPEGVSLDSSWVNDHTLKLSGTASLADYEKALKAVTFSTDNLGLVARIVGITLTDTDGVSTPIPIPVSVLVLPGIDIKAPPVLVATAPLLGFELGGAPAKLMTIAEITDADSQNLKEALVYVDIGRQVGDKLGYIAPAGVTLSATWINDYTLKLSGDAPIADYEAALKGITFSATQLGLIAREVTVSLTDADDVKGGGLVAAVVLPGIVIELPLTVVPVPNALVLVHTTGKQPLKLMSSVAIANADNGQLKGATVTINPLGRLSGDRLVYSGTVGSIAVQQTNDHTLTLSGLASVADYQAALTSIGFSSSQAGLARTVSITVTEEDGDTNPLPGLVSVSSVPPVRPTITTIGLSGLSFPNVGDTVKPITSATILDLDSTVLTGATVKISGNKTTGDTLAFTPIAGNPITAAPYNASTGVLTLSGTATVAQYKQALEAVTFKATQFGGGLLALFGNRTLEINITDDSNLTALLPGVVTLQVFRIL